MPTLAELDMAMARPGRYVPAVAELGGGAVLSRGDGQPVRVVGSRAAVYRLQSPTFGDVALRCFLADHVDRLTCATYDQLSRPPVHRRLTDAPHSPLVRQIAYFDNGLQLRGADLRTVSAPLVAMDWLSGPTLAEAVHLACQHGRSDVLRSLTEAWLRAMRALADVGAVHGGLSPANAMVDGKRGIVLIDYDTFWWPGLTPRTVSGYPAYRHPDHASVPGEQADDFAALVILTSLAVLAAEPRLRQSFGEVPHAPAPALLFGPSDLEQPATSPVFARLATLSDDFARALVGILRESCRQPGSATPSLRDAVAAARAAVRASSSAGQARTTAPPDLPDEQAGVHRPAPHVRSSSGASDDPPIAALVAAIDRADAHAVAELWPRCADDPRASPWAIPARRLLEADAHAVLRDALQSHDASALLAAIDRCDALGIPVGMEARRRARRARRSARRAEAIAKAVESGDRERLARLAWQTAVDDPAISAEHRRAMAAATEWTRLQCAIAEDDDAAIVSAVTPALWAERQRLDQATWDRVALARKRLQWRERVRRALAERDGSDLRPLTDDAPPAAHELLSPSQRRRLQRSIRQQEARERLRAAVAAADDRELIGALDELESVGATLPDDVDLERVHGLVDRLSVLAAIRRALRQEPIDDQRVARLLPAARDALGDQPLFPESDITVAALERLVQKHAHARRLREALRSDDDAAILLAADPDPFGVIETLPEAERRRVQRLVDEARRADPLRDAG